MTSVKQRPSTSLGTSELMAANSHISLVPSEVEGRLSR
jgi:hypothetical protein